MIYKLTYDSVEVTRAVFDRARAHNRWTIGAGVLKAISEHFGPKTEQLDIYYDAGRVAFTSYAERVMSGNGMSPIGVRRRLNALTSHRSPEAALADFYCHGQAGFR
jgi:hypothetical protein